MIPILQFPFAGLNKQAAVFLSLLCWFSTPMIGSKFFCVILIVLSNRMNYIRIIGVTDRVIEY